MNCTTAAMARSNAKLLISDIQGRNFPSGLFHQINWCKNLTTRGLLRRVSLMVWASYDDT